MLEPLLMSKAVFDKLPKDQQDVDHDVGAEMEKFGAAGAKADDARSRRPTSRPAPRSTTSDDGALGEVAGDRATTAWKDYAEKNEEARELLKLAKKWRDATGLHRRSLGGRGERQARPSPAGSGLRVGAITGAIGQARHRSGACSGVPCLVLTYSVVTRYFLRAPHRLAGRDGDLPARRRDVPRGAFVQGLRGHVGIEAWPAFLSPRANRCPARCSSTFCPSLLCVLRVEVVDAAARGPASTAQPRNSTWGPPLWIPYLLMAVGMTLLAVQFALQIGQRSVVALRSRGRGRGVPRLAQRLPDVEASVTTAVNDASRARRLRYASRRCW